MAALNTYTNEQLVKFRILQGKSARLAKESAYQNPLNPARQAEAEKKYIAARAELAEMKFQMFGG